MTRIPATTTVESLGRMQYSVEVEGALAYDGHRRSYVLKATSEQSAAMEGLRMFEDEIDMLDGAKRYTN